MKKLLTFLLLFPLAAFSATVTFNLLDFIQTTMPLTRRTMIIEPLSTVRQNGTNVITSERRFFNTGTNAIVIATNMNEGTYRCSVLGLNSTSVFRVNIPDTNGNLTASYYLVSASSTALETEEGTTIDLE